MARYNSRGRRQPRTWRINEEIIGDRKGEDGSCSQARCLLANFIPSITAQLLATELIEQQTNVVQCTARSDVDHVVDRLLPVFSLLMPFWAIFTPTVTKPPSLVASQWLLPNDQERRQRWTGNTRTLRHRCGAHRRHRRSNMRG